MPPGVRDAVIPVHPFTGLLALAVEEGWRVSEVFRGFEFDRHGQPLPGQHVSFQQAREIILLARHRAGPDAGVMSGERKSLVNLGVMSLGILAHRTVGEALAFGIDFQRLSGSMLEMSLGIEGREAYLAASSLFGDDETHGFLQVDHLLTSTNALAMLPTCGVGFRVSRVEVVGELAPEQIARLEREFRCPVLTHAENARAVFDSEFLETPLRFNDMATASLARQACERELSALGLATPTRDLRAALFTGDGRLRSPAEMADALGVSTRTLHRLLAAEGKRYVDMSAQAQLDRAKRLLASGRGTEEVADLLGYADGRSFRRAFERWTGETPARFRARR